MSPVIAISAKRGESWGLCQARETFELCQARENAHKPMSRLASRLLLFALIGWCLLNECFYAT